MVEKDFIEAYKAKEPLKLSTLRMLKTAIANKKIADKAAKESELADGDIIALIKSEVKKRKDSIEAYEKGGRADLSQKEAEEIKILEKYLPEQPSDEAIAEVIARQASTIGVNSSADFGRLMGAVMAEIGPGVDGQKVSALVKKFFNQ